MRELHIHYTTQVEYKVSSTFQQAQFTTDASLLHVLLTQLIKNTRHHLIVSP
jgi:hypothetical protein